MANVSFNRLSALRALIIDDMPGMRQNMRLHLGQLGMTRVDQAASPDEAIQMVERNAYDLVLCDFNLNKETNGQHLLEYFRSRNLLAESTIFIMVTAETSYSSVAAAVELKPDAYMLKPLTATKLAERIERMLDKQNTFLPISQRMARKDIPGAIAACDALLVSEPRWIVEILRLKGRMLLEQGQTAQAREVYTRALALRDDLVWARLGLAKCELIDGRHDAAKTAVEQMLKKNPQYIAAYDLLAQIATAVGNDQAVYDALSRSAQIIPSAPRSRLVGDAAYRVGDLTQARDAFSQAIHLSKSSMTGQASDLLSLAQVHVDAGEPELALKIFTAVPPRYVGSAIFKSSQAAMQAQAYSKLGDVESAQQAYATAQEFAAEAELGAPDAIDTTSRVTQSVLLASDQASRARGDNATLALAKAAFSVGRTEEGAALIAKAVKSDHENRLLVGLAKRVLYDTGNHALAVTLIDGAVDECLALVAEANALMRGAQFEASLEKLEQALDGMPDNTGVMLAAAQIYLLWMSQKGVNRDYVARVTSYLTRLEKLMPGNERVSKMHLFLRRTLNQNNNDAKPAPGSP